MIHLKCSGLWSKGVTYSQCEVCKTPIRTPHKPPKKICKKCSDKLSMCEQCAKDIKEGEEIET